MKFSALFGLFMFLFASPAWTAMSMLNVAVDASLPPIPPCTTFGYSVDATLTLPAGFDNARLVRVSQYSNNDNGYIVTSSAAGYQVYTFNRRYMVPTGSASYAIANYRNAGRLQGDVDDEGNLFIFNEVNAPFPGCASQCLMMSKWTGATLSGSVVDTDPARVTQNIDDAREFGSQFLVAVADAAASREFRLYDKGSLTFSSLGTDIGRNSFLHVSRALSDGSVYAFATDATNPNLWRFSSGATATGTANFAYGLGRQAAAIYSIKSSPSFVGLDSDAPGATIPVRSFVIPPTTLAGPISFSGGAADLQASFQGTFYDELYQKVFSLRTNQLGLGSAQRTTLGLGDTFVTEENFVCAACTNSGTTLSGTQIVDYAERMKRMYVGSSASPSVLTRLRVCAVGGP